MVTFVHAAWWHGLTDLVLSSTSDRTLVAQQYGILCVPALQCLGQPEVWMGRKGKVAYLYDGQLTLLYTTQTSLLHSFPCY